MRSAHGMLFIVILVLSGCAVQTGSSAPPPPPEVLTSQPTPTPTESPPTLEPTLSDQGGGGVGGTAGPGEIIFLREGQLWAVAADGTNERPLIYMEEETTIRHLSVSPDGHYLAFSLNANEATVLDLTTGAMTTVDRVAEGGFIDSLVWSPDSDVLYYQKMLIDPDTSAPVSSQLWRTVMPPGMAAELVLESLLAEGSSVSPSFVLSADTVILYRVQIGSESPGEHVMYGLETGDLVPFLTGFNLWDIAPDRSKMLLYAQADVSPGQKRVPVPLYVSGPNIGEAPTQASPDEDNTAFWNARFAPDSLRIVALRYAPGEEGLVADVVLLQPGEGGTTQMTILAPDEAYDNLAFSWHGEDGVIAQRWSLADGISEIWLLPLDGSPGVRLTEGESPVVVGGR